jgi:metal-sulfur cluster biosynthetic enzyme
MTLTPQEVFEALRSVPEPCSIAMSEPTDIVSMGLVESIRVDGGNVAVSLVLTDPSCVHFTALRTYMSDLLCERDDVDSVEVIMSTTQLWTADLMNPSGPPAPRALPFIGRAKAAL